MRRHVHWWERTGDCFVVLWSFVAAFDDELSVQKDELVRVERVQTAVGGDARDWALVARLRSPLEKGLVPRCFVVELHEFNARPQLYAGSWFVGACDWLEVRARLAVDTDCSSGTFAVCAPAEMSNKRAQQQFQLLNVRGASVDSHRIDLDESGRCFLKREPLDRYDTLYLLVGALHEVGGVGKERLGVRLTCGPPRRAPHLPTAPVPPPPLDRQSVRFDDAKPRVRCRRVDEPTCHRSASIAHLESLQTLELLEELGRGRLSACRRALWHRRAGEPACVVAVKDLLYVPATARACIDFFETVNRTATLQHDKLLQYLATVDASSNPRNLFAVLTEYAARGSLHCYLRSMQLTGRSWQPARQMEVLLQAARGLRFLEQRQQVHGHLCARNCLVTAELNGTVFIKLADYVIWRRYACQAELAPTFRRWLAVESLVAGTLTLKSDVWAFGILACELASLGERPYRLLRDSQIVPFLLKGKRHSRPVEMDRNLYDLAGRCWRANPVWRPTSVKLVYRLTELLITTPTFHE